MTSRYNTKISNLFVPSFPARLQMKKFVIPKLSFNKEEGDEDTQMRNVALPTGIIDSRKINRKYKLLLVEMDIQQFDNESSVVMISEQIEKYKKYDKSKKALTINIDIWYDEIKDHQSLLSEEALNSIFLWRTTHLPLSSIAFKFGI